MVCLLSPLAMAQQGVECQISTDNATWVNVEAATYGGCIDENSSITYARNLDSEITYHFRCKNATTDWGYLEQRAGGTQKMDASFTVIGFTFIVFTLALFGSLMFARNPLTKIFLVLLGLLSLMGTFFFGMEFLKIANPGETALIKVIESFFLGSMVLIAPSIIITFIVLVWFLIRKFINPNPRDRRDKEWEEYEQTRW